MLSESEGKIINNMEKSASLCYPSYKAMSSGRSNLCLCFFFQVQGWFQGMLEKQNQPKFKTAPSSPLLIVDLSNPGGVRDAGSPETVTYGQRVKG